MRTCLGKIRLVFHDMPACSNNIPLRINSLFFLLRLLYPQLAINYSTKAQQTTDTQVAAHNKTSCSTSVTLHLPAAAQQKQRTRPWMRQPSTLSPILNASQKVVLAGNCTFFPISQNWSFLFRRHFSYKLSTMAANHCKSLKEICTIVLENGISLGIPSMPNSEKWQVVEIFLFSAGTPQLRWGDPFTTRPTLC